MSDPAVKQAFLAEIRKRAPDLLGEAEQWLDSERRIAGHTDNATAQLITALTGALRAEMKGWAHARGDAVDYSLQVGELEAIVWDLADNEPISTQGESTLHGTWNECEICGRRNDIAGQPVDHRDDCAFTRSRAWVAARPAPAEETTSG